VTLPFCGSIQTDWCNGVKFNHGLHTQCTNGPSGDDAYCKTCRKHADNSATGKPPYGDINDRAKFNVDYRDPKGKLTVPYANVVAKLNINLETAEAAAATLGWSIPAEQLVKRVSKRGRPSKSAAVSDSESEGEVTEKKKRGRPSKAKVAAPTQEDQIAQLVAESYAETKTVNKKVKKLKVKKPKLSAEQKEQAKAEKKEAALAAKAEKKAAADLIKAEKKEAADKLKAEKKEAADKLKAEKKAAAELIKAEKKAVAEAKAEKKALALKARQEKAAAKKAEREAAALRDKEAAAKLAAEKAQMAVVVEELEEEVILEEAEIADLEIDSSDDEAAEAEAETELSETMTVGGVEYYFSQMDGQIILFSKTGEPVGVYDTETDTVQECEFDEE